MDINSADPAVQPEKHREETRSSRILGFGIENKRVIIIPFNLIRGSIRLPLHCKLRSVNFGCVGPSFIATDNLDIRTRHEGTINLPSQL